jgi:hypothetical protein
VIRDVEAPLLLLACLLACLCLVIDVTSNNEPTDTSGRFIFIDENLPNKSFHLE